MAADDLLLAINPRKFETIELKDWQILQWFNSADAYWAFEGEPGKEKAHAELTSGKCSNAYFDVPRVLKYPNIAEILGRQLGRRLRKESIGRVDWVVSSAYAAIPFGHEVAKELGAVFMYLEKNPDDPDQKRMLWRRVAIPAAAKVLQVEELITTSKTFKEVYRAVKEGNGEPVDFLPVIGALVHRPPKLPVDYGDRKVVALIEKEVWAADPKDCPHCRVGSPRYRPTTHWKELTGKG